MTSDFIAQVYKPFPFTVSRAKGVHVWDTTGKEYIDTFAGIGVLALGHSNVDVTKAIKNKLDNYTHLSNFFFDPDANDVAKSLVEKSGRNGKVYFGNSGTESNEAAIKAVKKRNGKILSFNGNFHGRTIGSLSITGFERLRKPFGSLLGEVVFLPFSDPQAFKEFMNINGENISAVFLETTLGSGGLKVITEEFADSIMEYKERFNFTLVIDEVQAGLGRTGKFYSYQHFKKLKPDIITTAKALGGGLPLSATIFLDDYSNTFSVGEHGSTFAPNPVALAAAKVVLSNLTEEFMNDVEQKGRYFREKLDESSDERFKEVRGMGLMIGVELNERNIEDWILDAGLKNGLLLNVVGGNTVRFLPALNITYDEIDKIVIKFKKIMDGFAR